ncbi:receptor-type tyrosine-protein phosphatase F isoform X1 [Hydra vulgaris]|uniref:receptor-type tyrosine-protein phosphatase F isoform X1 n=1 Tax=Hydra vulgaris TaxID=6087 RepID=UPI001F5F9C14|nr:receptor-type tyrosine-protein phosphatase F [Hydra vulgaris]
MKVLLFFFTVVNAFFGPNGIAIAKNSAKSEYALITEKKALVCTIHSSNAIIDLKKDDKTLIHLVVRDNNFINTDDNYTISGSKTNDTISISIKIKIKLFEDEGLYTCFVSYNNRIVEEESYNLTVFEKPAIALYPSNISYDLYNIEKLSVYCNGTGQPSPNVVWISSFSNEKIMSPWLNITKFNEIGLLEFTCQVFHHFGNSSFIIALVALKITVNIRDSKPQDFKADSDETSVLLQWKKPSYFGNFFFYYNLSSPFLNGILLDNTVTSYNYSNLQPLRWYTFYLASCSNFSCSDVVEREVYTQARPNEILEFKVQNKNATSITFFIKHGNLGSINNISFTSVCKEVNERKLNCANVTLETDSITFSNLHPYTAYQFLAKTCINRTELICYSEIKLLVNTSMAVPSPVKIIHVNYTDDENNSLDVKWCTPHHSKADKVQYIIVYKYLNDELNISLEDLHPINTCGNNQHEYSFRITNLSGKACYSIRVDAKNEMGVSNGKTIKILTDEEAPSAPISLTLVKKTETSLLIKWISPKTYVTGFEISYCMKDSDSCKHLKFGRDKSEAVISSLKEDTSYAIAISSYIIRSRNNKQYNSTKLETFFRTGKKQRFLILIPIILGMIMLIILAVTIVYVQRHGCVALFYRKKLFKKDNIKNEVRKNIRKNLMNTEVLRTSLNPIDFSKRVAELHSNSDYLFSEEFGSLGPHRPQSTCNDSRTVENQPKNRYHDIVAYDQTRFRLRTMSGVPGSNYINANYVDGYDRKNAYIATQAPLAHTICDFWRMVWESECRVIVMLTDLIETGKKKCDLYWPLKGSETYKGFIVTLEDTKVYASYIVRKLTIEKADKSSCESSKIRDVWHYQFIDWPDFGVPLNRYTLLSFILRTREHTDLASPVIVHCSAGVGRTGTYIVIDSQIKQFDDKGNYDVYNFLKSIRLQRNFLVQMEIQYIFIHDLLLDYMYSGVTEISIEDLEIALNQDYCRKEDNNKLHKEWQLLKNVSASCEQLTAALRPCNRLKNKCSNSALPVDTSRVRLTKKPFTDGSDYINASFFNGYFRKKAFIVTQIPPFDERDEFYRMVWENNVKVVVNLLTEEELTDICNVNFLFGMTSLIETGSNESIGGYSIEVIDERKENNYIHRTLTLSNTSLGIHGETRQLHHYHFYSWPELFFPRMAFLFYFINDVVNCQQQFGDSPLLIHCKNGIGRSGMLLALLLFKEQLEDSLKIVDVYNTVKTLRNQRLNMIESLEQYEFLYKAVVSLKHYILSNGS